MRTPPWSRDEAVGAVREQIWRYVSAATTREDLLLQAAALLDMPVPEVRALARVQFVLSDEVGALLDAMPGLVRRLTTTTEEERETSSDRVRGALAWGPTISARSASGSSSTYVTTPARRAFQTPENELLVFLLQTIADVARHTGWAASDRRDTGRIVRDRHDRAVRWLSARALQEVDPHPVTARTVARVRSGRGRRRFGVALEVYRRYDELVRHVDADAVRKAVEQHALITRKDSKLLELMTLFGIERVLGDTGWDVGAPRVIGDGGSLLAATRGSERAEVFVQRAMKTVSGSTSGYTSVLRGHGVSPASPLILDLLVKHTGDAGVRWVVVEVKGGPKRTVQSYARRALLDLLAYRQDGRALLEAGREPYGLGVVWGAELEPVGDGPVVLCTLDTLQDAVAILFPDPREASAPAG